MRNRRLGELPLQSPDKAVEREILAPPPFSMPTPISFKERALTGGRTDPNARGKAEQPRQREHPPGAGVRPQPRFQTTHPGPEARRRGRQGHRSRAPDGSASFQGKTNMGVPGGGRHGGREAMPNLPIAPIPWRSFAFFPIAGKEGRPSGRNPDKDSRTFPPFP